jgi:hypothetical protein
VAAGLQAANQFQTQAMVGQTVQQGVPTNVAAAGLAGQQQAAQAQQQVAQAQQAQAQSQQIAQAALQEQQRQAQASQFQRNVVTQEQALDGRSRLARLDQNLANELVDKQFVFDRDRAGAELMNIRNLEDFALSQAENREEFLNYQQELVQATDREIQVMQVLHQKLSAELEFRANRIETAKDQQAYVAMMKYKRKIEQDLLKKQERAALYGAAGGAIGTIVGAYFGGPAGAKAGGEAGQGGGANMASATE